MSSDDPSILMFDASFQRRCKQKFCVYTTLSSTVYAYQEMIIQAIVTNVVYCNVNSKYLCSANAIII